MAGGGKAIAQFGGLEGFGEVCPLGPAYLPAYAAGARAGIAELAPALLGEDPTQLEKLNRHMDEVLKGHPYVKSPLDMACCDLLGKSLGKSLGQSLGQRLDQYRQGAGRWRMSAPSSPAPMPGEPGPSR